MARHPCAVGGVGGVQRVDGLEAPLTGRDAEMRTSASCSTRRSTVGCRGWSWSPARPGSARPGSAGSSASTSTAWPARPAGTAAAACRTARARRSGRSPRSCGSDSASPRTTCPRRPPQAGGGGRHAGWPTRPSAATSASGSAGCSAFPSGDDPGGALSQDELFAGWRIFFERMAAAEPVVAAWSRTPSTPTPGCSTSSTISSTGRVTSRSTSSCFARPELERRRPGFGTGRNRVAADARPARRHVDGRARRGARPGPARRRLRRDRRPGAGHPAVRRRDGARADRPGRRPARRRRLPAGRRHRGARRPDSLHGLLAARLDALPPRRRRLVADAAVLGTTFPQEALVARVRRSTRTRWPTGLAELLRREVLTVVGGPALARARQLRVRPGAAAPGRLRHAVPPRPQSTTPRRRRPPPRRPSRTTARRSPTSSPGTTSTRSPPCRTMRTPTRSEPPRRTSWCAPPSGPSAPASPRARRSATPRRRT